jgi:hypothetical protein
VQLKEQHNNNKKENNTPKDHTESCCLFFCAHWMLLFDVRVPDNLVDAHPIRIGAFIVATFASFVLGLLFGILISLRYPLLMKAEDAPVEILSLNTRPV